VATHRLCHSLLLHMSTLTRPLPPCFFFFFNDPATTQIYTLSLHDALPISRTLAAVPETPPRPEQPSVPDADAGARSARTVGIIRSEEHTSELQSRFDLVCRLLLEKKKQHTVERYEQLNQRKHRPSQRCARH